MSNIIDQRVVEMHFDNQKFEDNVSTSMSTLEKLKQSLNFSNASKGLENLDASAKNVNMNFLGDAVQSVHAKFSALEVMGVTALANITNSAINAGKKIVSSLTIDPIKTGFSEYETQIGAIQTILANTSSKGTSLDDVNNALDILNQYADKTIYNFTEMTRNIGTFTAAGIDLDTSVNAIQGIANLAAVSGSTSQQASTAMYQLSQALASGTVKLMDWNSVVNAGMGGEVFQNALKETARVHGIAIDQLIAENGSFRDSLQEGWITAEILTETLEKFTMSTEGLTETEIEANREKLKTIGYTDDQIDGIFKLGKTATDAATKVKTFSQLYDTLKEAAQSGWTQTWEYIIGDFEESKTLFTGAYDAISSIINASAKSRNELVKGWKDLGGRTALIESIKNAFKGIYSIVTTISEAFKTIFPPATSQQLHLLTIGLKEFTEKLILGKDSLEKIKSTFKGLFSILDIVKQAFFAVFNAVKPLFGEVDNIGGGILDLTSKWGEWLTNLNKSIKINNTFGKGIAKIKELFSSLKLPDLSNMFNGSSIFGGLHTVLESIQKGMSNVSDSAANMKSGVEIAIDRIGNFLANSTFFNFLKILWESITKIGSGIAKAFGEFGSGFIDRLANSDYTGIIELLNAISIGGIAIGISKFVKNLSEVTKTVGGFSKNAVGILDSVKGCLESYQNSLKAESLKAIATAIAILVGALFVLSLIDNDALNNAIKGITLLFGELVGSLALLTKVSGGMKNVFKATSAMITMSAAVLIMAFALKSLGELSPEQLKTGIEGILGLTIILIAAAKIMSSESKTVIKGAGQMIVMAIALKILASACEDLSQLSWGQLAVGLTGIAGLMGEMIIFTKLIGSPEKLISTGIGLIAIAAAIKILASAIEDIGSLSIEQIGKGLLGMTGALLAISLVLNILPKDIFVIGVGLVAVSSAIVILAGALMLMGNMSWDAIAKGLVALGGSLLILAIGLNMMSGTLSGSAALIVAAIALAILTPVLSILGAMSWEAIAKGLVAIAGSFAIIGLAGLLLGPIVPAILALSGAILLIGVSILAAGAGFALLGVGLSLVAVGITALVASVAGGATALVAALTVIITGLIGLIPNIVEAVGLGIVSIIRTIAGSVSEIAQCIKTLVLSLIDVLVSCVPKLVEGALVLISSLLSSLATHAPEIIDSLITFIIGILDGLTARMPELLESIFKFVKSIFSGLIDLLNGMDFASIVKGMVGIGLMAGLVALLSIITPFIPGAMVAILGMGALIVELGLLLTAIGALAQIPGVKWLINEGGALLAEIGSAIGKFVGSIISGFASGLTSNLPKIGQDLSDFMTKASVFIEGAKKVDASVIDGVKKLIETIVLMSGANVVESFASWLTGSSSIDKFGDEIASFGPKIKSFADSVTGIKTESVENASNAAKILFEMSENLPNSGGLVSKIFGEKHLSDFATELLLFGPSLKAYALSVKGIKFEEIESSANAAKILMDLSTNLPNSGGLFSWFSGDNDIASFGKNLEEFGKSLAAYALSVSAIDANAIINSANAAIALSSFANSIPETGGFFSLFSGDSGMSDFGKNLVSFGESLFKYYDSIKNIDTTILTAVITEVNNLIAMAKSMLDIDTSSVSSFAKALKTLGQNGVDEFIEAFTDAVDDVEKAAKDMIQKFIDGVDGKKEDLKDKFRDLLDTAIEKIDTFWDDFKTAGAYMVDGFCNGITEDIWKAEAQARLMAQAADSAARDELGINSPSKVGYSIGNFFGLGFVKGISDYEDIAYNSSAGMADYAKKGLSNAVSKINDFVENGIDTQPTIRPVLDLSNLESGTRRISSLFSSSQAMSIGSSMLRSQEPKIINNNNSHSIGDIIVNVYGSNGDATSTGQEIGYQIERKLRYAGI